MNQPQGHVADPAAIPVLSFISTAESITSPYKWKQYDLLVLPPSFPYGGMENSCLTFVTPTLLAGDRSLVDVCAHEIRCVRRMLPSEVVGVPLRSPSPSVTPGSETVSVVPTGDTFGSTKGGRRTART
jgi:hypothetical protein